ncbi:hypothetical protein NC653_027729 [Populus alba x Populus x berolinensis]|nr:hypothetical protein NC653_027729 [Populus alba x Populus x berolinensis]
MENKIFSWMVVEEAAAAAVYLILDTNVGFGLVGAVRFGDIGGEQERAALVDDDRSALWVIGDPFLLLLLYVLNLGLSFEAPDPGPCAFSVPAFNGEYFSLMGGACLFTALSNLLLPTLFLLVVQQLPTLRYLILLLLLPFPRGSSIQYSPSHQTQHHLKLKTKLESLCPPYVKPNPSLSSSLYLHLDNSS